MQIITKRILVSSDDLHVEGLKKYSGKTARVSILFDETSGSNAVSSADQAFSVINSYSGYLQKWSREELHER